MDPSLWDMEFSMVMRFRPRWFGAWAWMVALLICTALGLLAACRRTESGAGNASVAASSSQNVVDVFIWADDIAADSLADFEKKTGIKVRLSYFDSPETLESRMLVGNSGFDLAVPTAAFLNRHIESGAYQALDKSRLPILAQLDPALMAKVTKNDPGNAHGVIYTWGTFGIGMNRALVTKALGAEPPNSWALVFDPRFASKLGNCGISFVDDPVGVVRLALMYLKRDPNDLREANLSAVAPVLSAIRPYIRNIDTSSQIQALANGDICVALGYNGNVVQAKRRALEAGNHILIDYLIPQEGSLLWFDLLAIPKDAPHVDNAYRFLNYLFEPKVIAHVTNVIGFANASTAATAFVDPSILADTAVYPTAEQRQRLVTQVQATPEQARDYTRLWQNFKIGR